ncbi:MAG: helix-turn-helix transcriptional regulator [Firmicutes bacterium]|nr:helix-turn-helix transcriptional regulator [Bacillota bacterium]
MTNSKQQNIYNVIGKNIKKYRQKKGYTQRALAEKLLLSESFIAKLESDTYQSISIDTLEQIAIFLEVDITIFFDKSVMEEKKELVMS